MQFKMWYVYILQSNKDSVLYKGLTNNIDKRLKQHLQGQSKTTKKLLPLKLVYVEVCKNRVEARKMEKFFKSGFGREVLEEIIS